MIIYSPSGPHAFKTFEFPDGQPHFELLTKGEEFRDITIEAAIRNPKELFNVMLAIDTLRNLGHIVSLDIRYLMGARMDRRISAYNSLELQVVMQSLNTVRKIRVLDAHNPAAVQSFSAVPVENILPHQALSTVLATVGDVEIVIPDKGAIDRAQTLTRTKLQLRHGWVQCLKERDPATGKLSSFTVVDHQQVAGKACLIVDDICDGGGTFVGLAKELRRHGATKVFLFVTHGIFSKGLPLEGIDEVYTTNSYHAWDHYTGGKIPVCVPIWMKEIK